MTNKLDDTFSGKNISATSTLLYTWTAVNTGLIQVQLFLQGVVGGGNYIVHLTKQVGGTGLSYPKLPKQTCIAATPETEFHTVFEYYEVETGDILKFYALGLGGDINVSGRIKIFDLTLWGWGCYRS